MEIRHKYFTTQKYNKINKDILEIWKIDDREGSNKSDMRYSSM